MTRTRTILTLLVLVMAASAQAATITGVTVEDYSGRLMSSMDVGNAIDGNPATTWYTNTINDGVSNPWVILNLNDTYTVGDVTMTSTTSGTYRKFSQAQVSVSTDGTNFTTIGTFAIDVGNGASTTFNLGDVDASYVRFEAVEAYYENWTETESYATTATASLNIAFPAYGASIAEISFDAVPEPMTMSVLAVGGLAMLKRRRK